MNPPSLEASFCTPMEKTILPGIGGVPGPTEKLILALIVECPKAQE